MVSLGEKLRACLTSENIGIVQMQVYKVNQVNRDELQFRVEGLTHWFDFSDVPDVWFFRENEVKEYDFINPNHYKQGSKEVIEMMELIWGKENLIAYCEMNAFKYRMRLGLKPEQSVERDLEKANWYSAKAKELRG
jgi:hypothetical protein